MNKNKLLLIPFLVGLAFMAYSWYVSYPLSIDSPDDFVFNHVSVTYWFGLSLLFAAMFMIAVTFKNNTLRWLMTVGIVMAFYSLSYFYYMLPSSDSHYFRGQMEYLIDTGNLNPSYPNRFYFQWPSFFVLGDVATSVSGIGLATYEFLLYSIIGFLFATALYIYASNAYRHGCSLSVTVFFVVMFYFLNFQVAPFSLAFALLLLLFVLETQQKSFAVVAAMIVLFMSISITHAFVPLFFLLYLATRIVLKEGRRYTGLFMLSLSIYLLVQITQAQYGLAENIYKVVASPTEYSGLVAMTLAARRIPTDVLAQTFSRTITVGLGMICLAGFILALVRRKLRELDKAIFITGALYSGLGIILYTLGSRAIPIAFAPVSLGAAYLMESRFRPYVKFVFLVILVLVPFIPLHDTFTNSPIAFQTKEAHATERFLIENNYWGPYRVILMHVSAQSYILPQIDGNTIIKTDFSTDFRRSEIESYDSIIYSVGLAINLQRNNTSLEETSHRIEDGFNVVYSSGFSYIAKKRGEP